MNFTIGDLLPWLSVVVIPLGGWLVKLQLQVFAVRREGEQQLHLLERDLRKEMVNRDQLQQLETRLEKKLDQVIALIQHGQ
jgi:hypothetical protein